MEKKTRPFHETIVEALQQCRYPSTGEAMRLLRLIQVTEIPMDHDEIIVVIDKFFHFPGAGKWAREIREVKESILAQKREADERKSEGVDLEDLQKETEKLTALLKDRHPGLMTWNEFMRASLQNLHRLASQALGK